jgi:hypothetical protein
MESNSFGACVGRGDDLVEVGGPGEAFWTLLVSRKKRFMAAWS